MWRDYDPSTVPADYQGYYARDQRLASGPHPGEPTPEEVRKEGTKFCVGTPAECIRFLERYVARSRVVVYYNPSNVADSVLEPHPGGRSDPALGLGVALIALGLWCLMIYDWLR